MEEIDQARQKESRTDKLLRLLKVGPDFGDPKLPKGFMSHSQYISWKICARAYEFKYVQKIKTPNYPSTTKGQSVHSGVEFMLLNKRDGRIPPIAEGMAVVSQVFDREAERVEKWDENEPIGVVKDSAIALFNTFAVYAMPQIKPLEIEQGFAKKFGDVPMVGWIDLIDEQPALSVKGMSPEEAALAPVQQVAVDFKTGKAKWSENELRLDTQMTAYSYVKGTPRVRVDQLLAKKKAPEYVRGDSVRTPEDAAIFIEDLNETADFIKRGIFPKTTVDNWACNEKHCAFWSLCRGRKR